MAQPVAGTTVVVQNPMNPQAGGNPAMIPAQPPRQELFSADLGFPFHMATEYYVIAGILCCFLFPFGRLFLAYHVVCPNQYDVYAYRKHQIVIFIISAVITAAGCVFYETGIGLVVVLVMWLVSFITACFYWKKAANNFSPITPAQDPKYTGAVPDVQGRYPMPESWFLFNTLVPLIVFLSSGLGTPLGCIFYGCQKQHCSPKYTEADIYEGKSCMNLGICALVMYIVWFALIVTLPIAYVVWIVHFIIGVLMIIVFGIKFLISLCEPPSYMRAQQAGTAMPQGYVVGQVAAGGV